MLKPKKEARGAIRASKVVKAANSKSKRTEDHIPMVLSNPLSAFLGGEKLLSKAEVEKRLWVFQKPWTTQFLIGRILKPHLTKPEEIVNHVMMPEKDAFMAMDVASPRGIQWRMKILAPTAIK
ncbi:hypothetical protein BC829DRAFT_404097 [Chytridium lagenaria]|nr:hypothetical protein BC829DRAFT_404097 [Chytridium lagenaria]